MDGGKNEHFVWPSKSVWSPLDWPHLLAPGCVFTEIPWPVVFALQGIHLEASQKCRKIPGLAQEEVGMRMIKAKLPVPPAPSLASCLGRGISFLLLSLGHCWHCRWGLCWKLTAGLCWGTDQAVRAGTGSCPGFPKSVLGSPGELGEC